MQKRVLAIVLICMVIPYLYWYFLTTENMPTHLLGKYLIAFGSSGSNNSGTQSLSYPAEAATTEDTIEIHDTKDNLLGDSESIPLDERRPPPKADAASGITERPPGVVDVASDIQRLSSAKSVVTPPRRTLSQSSALIVNGGDGTSNVGQTVLETKNPPPLKKIVFWNSLRSRFKKNFGLGTGRGAFLKLGCSVNTCTVISKKEISSYDEVDAVVWHQRSRDTSFPPRRSPHTRYIFMLAEPPGHVKRLRNHRNVFNWTLTYRWDSDIPIRIGQVQPLDSPGPDLSHVDYAAGKTKMAVWFVSNCGTDSGRSKVTKLLKKYFPVDVYGKCGSLKCPRFTKIDCYKKVEPHYKFYLSFENSICRDYVTEKFFNVLNYNMVPVVYGGADYSAIAPQKSYINSRDFPTVEALAKYLLYLNSNDTAYNEYFWWKSSYEVLAVSSSKSLSWCHLCEKLHTDNTAKSYPDIRDWYIKQAKCQSKKYGNIKRFLNG